MLNKKKYVKKMTRETKMAYRKKEKKQAKYAQWSELERRDRLKDTSLEPSQTKVFTITVFIKIAYGTKL